MRCYLKLFGFCSYVKHVENHFQTPRFAFLIYSQNVVPCSIPDGQKGASHCDPPWICPWKEGGVDVDVWLRSQPLSLVFKSNIIIPSLSLDLHLSLSSHFVFYTPVKTSACIFIKWTHRSNKGHMLLTWLRFGYCIDLDIGVSLISLRYILQRRYVSNTLAGAL